MLIAIDYDGTFSADPELFTAFVRMIRERGHEAICVTSRGEDLPVKGFPGEVVYTDGEPKAAFADDAGHYVDVWIDDAPHLIGRVSF